MGRRVRVFAAALALVFVSSAAGLFVGSGTALASQPIVIGSCATSVQGTPGQPVSLSPSAVLSPVVSVVRALDPLNLITPTVRNTFAALPPIPIGALPDGKGYITGGTIANAVNAQLRNIPILGPILSLVVSGVQSTLTSMCGVTVTGVNAVAAPVQDGAEAVADAANKAAGGTSPGTSPGPGTGLPGTSPGGGGGGGSGGGGGATTPPPGANQPVLGGNSPSGIDLSRFMWTGRSPMADYSSIPFARPGLFAPSPGVLYGGSVSGYTPQFGILGTDNRDGVQAAGHAEALEPSTGDRIALPVLLAVLALSMVTAALVRTWVLRKAPAIA